MPVFHIHYSFVNEMRNTQNQFTNAFLSLSRAYMGIDSIWFIIFSSFFAFLDCEPVFELTDTSYFFNAFT